MDTLKTLVSAAFIAGMAAVGAGIGTSPAANARVQGDANTVHAPKPAAKHDLGIPAHFLFQTIDNTADPAFNQLLGINDNYKIAGVDGSGASGHPSRGYTVGWPYARGDFTKDNFPHSGQSSATGINNAGDTVGLYRNGTSPGGAQLGFIHVRGKFTKVVDPHTPRATSKQSPFNQLLGVNNHDVAVGFYFNSTGNAQGYTFSLKNHSFSAVSPPTATSEVATGINDSGDVCGFFVDETKHERRGFLEHQGEFTTIKPPGALIARPFGVNNADVVVGSYIDSSGASHGFIFAGGKYQTVDDPSGAPGTTTVTGINNHYSLVGFSVDASGITHGFEANPARDHSFRTIDNANDPASNQLSGINNHNVIAGYLGAFGGDGTLPQGYVVKPPYAQADYAAENFPKSLETEVTGIDNAGDTVGLYVPKSGAQLGFTDVGGHFTSVKDPKTPPPTSRFFPGNSLLGINSHGEAVGFYDDFNGDGHAYEYHVSKRSFQAITPPHASSAQATDINDAGDVCGFFTNQNGDEAGFFERNGKRFVILQFPGATDTTPLGLNNKGQMVGTYVDSGGTTHSFLYTDGTWQTIDPPNGVGTIAINGLNDSADLVGSFTDSSGNTHGLEVLPR